MEEVDYLDNQPEATHYWWLCEDCGEDIPADNNDGAGVKTTPAPYSTIQIDLWDTIP